MLDTIQPSLFITIDTEIWPNVLHETHKRGIPIVMVNGRISAQSFQYYRWVQPLMGPVFQNYSLLLMKSQEDADRLQRMGAPPSKMRVSGNIKYDRNLVEKEVTEAQASALDQSLALTASDAPLIVAGSTHDGEEADPAGRPAPHPADAGPGNDAPAASSRATRNALRPSRSLPSAAAGASSAAPTPRRAIRLPMF